MNLPTEPVKLVAEEPEREPFDVEDNGEEGKDVFQSNDSLLT